MPISHEDRTARRKRIAERVRAIAALGPEHAKDAVYQVAREFEVSEQTVRTACRIHGVHAIRKASGQSVSLDVVRDLIAREEAGEGRDTIRTIAERHGVSERRVYDIAARVGITTGRAVQRREREEATA